jgi:hypothetical protein
MPRGRTVRTTRGLPQKLDELIELICRSSEKEIVQQTAAALRRGASAEQLLQAAFLAPEISGAPVDLHAQLVVPSIQFHFLAGRSDEERLLPVFWCVWNAQSWCHQVAPGGRAAAPAALKEPSLTLSRALSDGDAPTAVAAASALAEKVGRPAALARLRLEASHPRIDPHVAICAAQFTRMMPMLGEEHQGVALRSVARHLASGGLRRESGPRFASTQRTPSNPSRLPVP